MRVVKICVKYPGIGRMAAMVPKWGVLSRDSGAEYGLPDDEGLPMIFPEF